MRRDAQDRAIAETQALIVTAFQEDYDGIVRYIGRRIDQPDLAPDLTSEVFARALRSASTFKNEGKPIKAWLYTIARNLVTDYHRLRARSTIQVPLDSVPDLAGDEDPVAGLIADEHVAMLFEAVAKLTDAERKVIAMKYSGQMSAAEIGRALGKTPGAVRWLQHSGLMKLRRILSRLE